MLFGISQDLKLCAAPRRKLGCGEETTIAKYVLNTGIRGTIFHDLLFQRVDQISQGNTFHGRRLIICLEYHRS